MMRRGLQKPKGTVEFWFGKFRRGIGQIQSTEYRHKNQGLAWAWSTGILLPQLWTCFNSTIFDMCCYFDIWKILLEFYIPLTSKRVRLLCRKLGKDCVLIFDIKLCIFSFMPSSIYHSLESILWLIITAEFTRHGCIEASRFRKWVWKIN